MRKGKGEEQTNKQTHTCLLDERDDEMWELLQLGDSTSTCRTMCYVLFHYKVL